MADAQIPIPKILLPDPNEPIPIPKLILPSGGFSDEQQTAPYDKYDLRVRYEYNSGVILLPVAGPTPDDPTFEGQTAAKIVQASQPFGRKIVRFHLIRTGMQPIAPDPTPTNSNEILKKAVVVLKAPSIMPDGATYIWTMKGLYIYLLYQPYFTSNPLSAGTTQVDTATLDDNTITPGNFETGMI